MKKGTITINELAFDVTTICVTGERPGHIFQITGVDANYRYSSVDRYRTSESAYDAAIIYLKRAFSEDAIATRETINRTAPRMHVRIQITKNTKGYSHETTVSYDCDENDAPGWVSNLDHMLQYADIMARREIGRRAYMDSLPVEPYAAPDDDNADHHIDEYAEMDYEDRTK